MTLTPHQTEVMMILYEEGRIVSVHDEYGQEHNTVDRNGNIAYAKTPSVQKLHRLGLIYEKADFPAFGVDTWYITGKGREWVEENTIKKCA